MRGLQDVSKLAAAAALVFGIVGLGTFGCSAEEPGVDAAPPMEGDLVEIDEIDEMQEEESQY